MHEEPFSSNAVRLSVGECSAVLAVLVCATLFIGGTWQAVEPFDPGADYRIPYALSEDYWFFQRFCSSATGTGRTLVFGDSFVWGQYVEPDQTLTHLLNERAGSDTFVNAGLDGAHPLALDGLLRHHCGRLHGEDVLLHLNLLWLSSAQADLQAEEAPRVNHSRLLPQFVPAIPAYQASVSSRLGIVVARYVPVFDWGRHLRITYFRQMDLGRWTLEHPYANPLGPLTLDLPVPEGSTAPGATEGRPPVSARAPSARPTSQASAASTQQALPWVGLESSLQWQAFRRTVGRLRSQGNRVSVLLGPLNEHMLDSSSATAYHEILTGAREWLRENEIGHYVPPTLPAELYADLSHPNAEGYAVLADSAWAWLARGAGDEGGRSVIGDVHLALLPPRSRGNTPAARGMPRAR